MAFRHGHLFRWFKHKLEPYCVLIQVDQKLRGWVWASLWAEEPCPFQSAWRIGGLVLCSYGPCRINTKGHRTRPKVLNAPLEPTSPSCWLAGVLQDRDHSQVVLGEAWLKWVNTSAHFLWGPSRQLSCVWILEHTLFYVCPWILGR